MNKGKFLIPFAVSVIIAFIVGIKVIQLSFWGITVQYQRNSGPDLLVINHEERLYDGSKSNEKIDYSELIVIDELDLETGPSLEGKTNYTVYGKIIDFKPADSGSKLYPVFKIKIIVSPEEFILLIIIFILLIISVLFFSYKTFSHKHIYGEQATNSRSGR